MLNSIDRSVLSIRCTSLHWKISMTLDMKLCTLGGGIPNSVPNSSKLQERQTHRLGA